MGPEDGKQPRTSLQLGIGRLGKFCRRGATDTTSIDVVGRDHTIGKL